MKAKTCLECDKEFVPQKLGQKTCSPKCQRSIDSKKKKENAEKAKAKKAKLKEKKQSSPSYLAKKLDILFSKYIRLRDCIKTTGTKDKCVCVTSGEVVSGPSLNCGHFMSRRHKAVSWCEANAHGQSAKDNLYGAGQQYLHSKAVDQIHGKGVADWLCQEALKTFKFDRFCHIWVDYKVAMTPEEAIAHYERKIGELEA